MRQTRMTLFEFGWLSEYLSLSRAGIVVASILIVLHCVRMSEGGGSRPPAYERIGALFGTATFSNAVASLASLNPNVYFGLALALLNTVVVVILFGFVVKGWEQPDSQNIADDIYGPKTKKEDEGLKYNP